MAVAHTFGLRSMQPTDPKAFVNVDKYAQKTVNEISSTTRTYHTLEFLYFYAELYVYSEL